MLVSQRYTNITGKKQLFNIMPIENIPSVIKNGILSYYSANRLNHRSVAMNEIQQRRERVRIPNGLRLHQYANLYFAYNNPMLYKRKDIADSLCILTVSTAVLDIPECVVSDMNASASYVRFFSPEEGIEKIEFDKVFEKYWTHDDYFDTIHHKAIKCAEVLVPNCIDYNYITGACVKTDMAKQQLINMGFNKTILVRPDIFY